MRCFHIIFIIIIIIINANVFIIPAIRDGGTIFLDEIGELPLQLPTNLLRFLQEGVISRLGQNSEIKLDVRVIAATHRDLQYEVAEGRFREDLYYRYQYICLLYVKGRKI